MNIHKHFVCFCGRPHPKTAPQNNQRVDKESGLFTSRKMPKNLSLKRKNQEYKEKHKVAALSVDRQ